MKKNKGIGLFGKVFIYTLLFLLIIICITAALFASQFTTILETNQKQQIMNNFQPLINQLDNKTNDEKTRLAEAFHENNSSYVFLIKAGSGEIIYGNNINYANDFIAISLSDETVLYILDFISPAAVYIDFFSKTAIVFVTLLLISIIGAAIFARGITKPIMKLAVDTTKMVNLESVSPPVKRSDEIGRLSNDVHRMYEHLKRTIAELEIEIEQKKEMEENQIYFFSAASHELKTPVASASTMLESMIEEWVPFSDYPKYLRECLKMMQIQGKLISEILEIVRLSEDKIQFNIQHLNLKNEVNSVILSYQALLDAKEQNISILIPDNLICYIDQHMFNRVLSNIIMNAIQNSPEQGEICIWSENQSIQEIRLCILNKNAHIDEDILPKLFEAFYRTDKVRNKSISHTGLGLTIVKKALDLMKISFSLENTDDGVLFWMLLSVM